MAITHVGVSRTTPVDLFRRVDFFVGIPLCFLLTLLSRLLSRPPRDGKQVQPRRLLCIKLSEMGSLVLVYPMLRRAVERWPGCKLFFLTFKENREALSLLGMVPEQNVFTVDTSSVLRFLSSTVAVLIQLRQARLDASVDLEFFSRFSTILSFLSGARARVGFYRFHSEGLYCGNLLTHRVVYNPYLHTAKSFLSLVEALALDPDDTPMVKTDLGGLPLPLPRFRCDAQVEQRLLEKLQLTGPGALEGRRIFIVNPNASEMIPIRRWPLDRYIRLAELLLLEPHHLVVIIGKGSDAVDARKIKECVDSPRCLDMTNRTDLRELLTLFALATAMVSNDSGPAHFASMTDLPAVILFGPETPLLYAPLGKRQRSLTASLACSPCVSVYNQRKTTCRYARCLEVINVEQVLATLKELGVPGLGTALEEENR